MTAIVVIILLIIIVVITIVIIEVFSTCYSNDVIYVGRRYLSNATCLIRPHLFSTALLV